MAITRSGEDLAFEDVRTSNSKARFTGKIPCRRLSDGGNTIDTLSDDRRAIVCSDWVR